MGAPALSAFAGVELALPATSGCTQKSPFCRIGRENDRLRRTLPRLLTEQFRAPILSLAKKMKTIGWPHSLVNAVFPAGPPEFLGTGLYLSAQHWTNLPQWENRDVPSACSMCKRREP